MPLQKVNLKPGVNKEITSYSGEGGWWDSEKVRFRQQFPERIGGWTRISTNTFIGVCRSLWNWVTLGSQSLVAIGTNSKYYLENGGQYYDITPIRATVALTNPFTTTSGSPTVAVADGAQGYIDGDYVTFSGATAVGGITLDGEYLLSSTSVNTYEVTHTSNASSSASGGGSVTAAYQINIGPPISVPIVGWSGGFYGEGTWGTGGASAEAIRIWTEDNFGEDLLFGPVGGPLYIWDATNTVTTRGTLLSAEAGASNVPVMQNYLLISDVSRFVFSFGCNALGDTALDPLLIRWSDQEDATNWTPSATNQAGDIRLSKGSKIIVAMQARQEILVWTDSSLYSLQYVGAPVVWSSTLVGDNLSLMSVKSTAYTAGAAYWMGIDKFYRYDGTASPLRCDIRKHIFEDFNYLQQQQVFVGTIEAFTEVWWFYCSKDSMTVDKYAVYNYGEDIWYHGSLGRTAWLDSGLRQYPIAATYTNNLVNHEEGLDDNETGVPAPIDAYIESSDFDIADGDRFSFIWRVIPDITFHGSSADNPYVDFTLLPKDSSGSGYNSPSSEGGTDTGVITRTATVPVEQYTTQLNIRVRGRQVALKISSDSEGVAWQLGVPRLDTRPDGRR
jgi:hypothetical protein